MPLLMFSQIASLAKSHFFATFKSRGSFDPRSIKKRSSVMRKHPIKESNNKVVEAKAVDDLASRLYEKMPSVMSQEKIKEVVMLGLKKGLRLQEIELAFSCLVTNDIKKPAVTWRYDDRPLRRISLFEECQRISEMLSDNHKLRVFDSEEWQLCDP